MSPKQRRKHKRLRAQFAMALAENDTLREEIHSLHEQLECCRNQLMTWVDKASQVQSSSVKQRAPL